MHWKELNLRTAACLLCTATVLSLATAASQSQDAAPAAQKSSEATNPLPEKDSTQADEPEYGFTSQIRQVEVRLARVLDAFHEQYPLDQGIEEKSRSLADGDVQNPLLAALQRQESVLLAQAAQRLPAIDDEEKSRSVTESPAATALDSLEATLAAAAGADESEEKTRGNVAIPARITQFDKRLDDLLNAIKEHREKAIAETLAALNPSTADQETAFRSALIEKQEEEKSRSVSGEEAIAAGPQPGVPTVADDKAASPAMVAAFHRQLLNPLELKLAEVEELLGIEKPESLQIPDLPDDERPRGATKSSLESIGTLKPDDSLVSDSGNNELFVQQDGNVVLYRNKKPVWAASTWAPGRPGHRLDVQEDGNLVVYSGSRPIWASGSSAGVTHKPYKLTMQDDGNLVMYDKSGRPVWTSGTTDPNYRPPTAGVGASAVVTPLGAPVRRPRPVPASTPGVFPDINEISQPGGDGASTSAAPEQWLVNANRDWMGKLPNEKRLRDMSIPGTHDSGSLHGGILAECQTWSITEQLQAGIRFLDIRCMPVNYQFLKATGGLSTLSTISPDVLKKAAQYENDSFAICHSFFFQYATFDNVMNEIVAFLNEQPRETVIIRWSKENSDSDSFGKIQDEYVRKYSDYFYHGPNADPTLGELRGKVFVMGQHRTFEENGKYGHPYKHDMDIQDAYKVYWDPRKRGSAKDDWCTLPTKGDVITEFMNLAATSPNRWVLNYCSGSTGMAPYDVARQTNKVAFENCFTMHDKKLGIVVMDFPGERLLYRIVASNFDFNARAPSVPAKTFRSQSHATWVEFRLPAASGRSACYIPGGAYAKYKFPKCGRNVWSNLYFRVNTSTRQWELASGDWRADGLCHGDAGSHPYVHTGTR